jgi:hypothetical protein
MSISPTRSRSPSPEVALNEVLHAGLQKIDPKLGKGRAFKNQEEAFKIRKQQLEPYVQAVIQGAVTGLSEVALDLLHPVDRVVKPLAQFLDDQAMLFHSPAVPIGHLEAPIGVSEVWTSEKAKQASTRNTMRIEEIRDVANAFSQGTGPQRTEMLAAVLTPALLTRKIAGAILPSPVKPPCQVHFLVFKTSENATGRVHLSAHVERKKCTIHIYNLKTEGAQISERTLPGGVFPKTVAILQKIAQEHKAERLLVQADLANPRLESVFRGRFRDLGKHPFVHQEFIPQLLQDPSLRWEMRLFCEEFQTCHNLEYPIFELPLQEHRFFPGSHD